MLDNRMLGSTYLSPLKTQVISHNVKTIKLKNKAWSTAEAGNSCSSHGESVLKYLILYCKSSKDKLTIYGRKNKIE